ncbi:MAG: AAA family ATPase [Rhodocyclaceae bacterium]|nr:AAA family ATPase [Rhodocyclaceae bacterium]
MDFATRRKYYNRCRAYESLAPDDERNLDIDFLYGARGIGWAQRLGDAIELSDQPEFLLLTGLPGSGKSTELRRLAERLRTTQSGASFLPVLVDADEMLDLTNPIDIPDVIAALLYGLEAAILALEGKDAAGAMESGYFSRLWDWLTKTDVELGKAEFAIPGGGPKLVAEMRSRPGLRAKVRNIIGSHLSRFLQDARTEFLQLQARAGSARQVVLIFDSLEKLRGTSGNWDKVLASAERLFSGGAPYLRLPVHVLYTVPPALVNRCVERIYFLPMIKLADRSGTRHDAGYDAARDLVRRRVPDDLLLELFGPQAEARTERLIAWSGGYPREIVRLLQQALAVPEQPLTEPDFERIFNELKDAFRKAVPAEAFPWLARVAEEKYLTIRDDKHRAVADLMLSNNAVLRYLNDNDWFDLHPAVAQIPGVIEARAAAGAEAADGG